MTKRPTKAVAVHDEPELIGSADALAKALGERMDIGVELTRRALSSPEDVKLLKNDSNSWDEYNSTLIRQSFSSLKPADDYRGHVAMYMGGRSAQQQADDQIDFINRQVRKLGSLREQLPLYAARAVSTTQPSTDSTGTDVFIVHGHNNALKQEVARFVNRICGTEPLILHELANGGRTVIEKLEQVSTTVGFAVILLTSDDEGGIIGTGSSRPRARQNVVFELGLFIGLLRRSRVAVLYEAGVELPSDMSGVVYTEIDSSGGWKLALAKELQAAGISIDHSKLV